MKKIILASAVAVAAAGLFTPSAHALTYTEGDLFIGFYDSAVSPTTDYMIDVGQASLYTKNNGSSFTVLTSSNGSNLSTIYAGDGGAGGWYANGNTVWGVVGGPTSTDLGNTLYASTATDNLPASFSPNTNTNQGGFYTSKIGTAAGDFLTNGTSYNGTNGTTQLTSDTNSFAAKGFNASVPFGFANSFSGDINNDGAGAETQLALFQVIPTNEPGFPSGGVINEGTFTIDSTGTVTYQSAGSVPEPSTFGCLAGGLGLLGLLRRRRALAA
ncbi:MAG TPA: PEP-CTERM sorting domain-containing protein [Chthoniobacter sp.]|jgi:hypothetical protein